MYRVNPVAFIWLGLGTAVGYLVGQDFYSAVVGFVIATTISIIGTVLSS